MTSPASLDAVRDYWNRRPCNIQHDTAPMGTREYFDQVEAEKTVEKRLNRIVDFGKIEEVQTGGRKRSIQDALKEFDAKQAAREQRNKKPPLAMRLVQAGLDWNRKTYLMFSAGTAANSNFAPNPSSAIRAFVISA